MTGFDLQRALQVRGQKIPIVFITAQTDGRAFEGGAVGFLLKPFSDTALLSSHFERPEGAFCMQYNRGGGGRDQ